MMGFVMATAFTFTLPAQQVNVLEGPLAQEWIDQCRQVQSTYSIAPEFILNPPALDFPPDMMDTLKTYDWLRVGKYWYDDNQWGGDRQVNNLSGYIIFNRYQADGTCLDMRADYLSVPKAVVYDEGRDLDPPMYVKDEANYTWLCWDTGDPTECMRLVYYQDGLLMIDVSDAPAGALPPINYERRIRNVYIALPKTF